MRWGDRPWRRALAWLAALAPLFYASYGFANHWAATRPSVPTAMFSWEQGIPFMPWTILPYWSINGFYAASLFVCRTRYELDAHGKRLLAAQALAVACFLVVPLRFSLNRPSEIDGWAGVLFAALSSFDQPFNQAPSLHIALMIILWSLYAPQLPLRWRIPFHLWFGLIGVSVLTTYQHHFIDIPAGLWLGWLCVALFPLRPRHLPGGWWPLHQRRPERPAGALRVAGFYAVAGAVVLALGVWSARRWMGNGLHPANLQIGLLHLLASLGAVLLCWSGGSLLLVAAIYARGQPRLFQKSRRGRMSAAVRWLLGPYLLGAWLNSRWWTRHDGERSEVAPGVHLSRLPSGAELGNASVCVVDLCAELPLPKLSARAATDQLPVLDLTVPSSEVLNRAVCAMERALVDGAEVWVCCALGYSRSASAVAAWLLRSGRAMDSAHAHRLLLAARPGIRLRDAHWEAISKTAPLVRSTSGADRVQ